MLIIERFQANNIKRTTKERILSGEIFSTNGINIFWGRRSGKSRLIREIADELSEQGIRSYILVRNKYLAHTNNRSYPDYNYLSADSDLRGHRAFFLLDEPEISYEELIKSLGTNKYGGFMNA